MRTFAVHSRVRVPLLLAAALALVMLVAAYDSSSSGASTARLSAASKAGLARAEAVVAQHDHPITTIGPSVPITKKIPTGKNIIYINCGAQSCINTGDELKQAASILGWHVTWINAQPTPQAIQAAWTQALRDNPSGVASLGFANSTVQNQLNQLEQKHIPVINGTGTDPSNLSKNYIDILEPSQVAKETEALADKMIVDAGGKGEIGVAFLTGYPGVQLYTQAFESEVRKNCPACQLKVVDVAPTAIGTTAGSQIATWLRSNPGVGHLFLSYDDLGIGLPTAAANAGATLPKLYGQAPTDQGMEALKDGQRVAATPGGGATEVAWVIADAFARSFAGQSMAPDVNWGPFPIWSKAYHNLPTTGQFYQAANYEKLFKKLWGK